MDRVPADARLYTLLGVDPDGCTYTKHAWRTTEEKARKYAARYAAFMDFLVGPRGETLERY